MIKDMQKKNPDRKVGLVTFSGDVCIIGDGTMAPTTIAGDKLNDFNFIKGNGEQLGINNFK